MNQPLVVIVNPASGSHAEDFRQTVENALRDAGVNCRILETTPQIHGDELARQAVQQGARHVVACGGDGTIMEVVNGLGKSQAPETTPDNEDDEPSVTLSIIPGGTANLLATALGIPTDPDEAAQVVAQGVDRVIDLGRCGDHLFALGVGLGLTERLVSQASARGKEIIGRWAYAYAMLRELGAPPHRFRFKLDEGKWRRAQGVAIVIANSGDIGGKLQFAPDAKMDDGLLDLCILRRFYLRDLVRMAWHTLRGVLPEDRAVAFYQARRIEVRSDPPLDLQLDGEEVAEQTPLIAQVLPRHLKVRVPRQKES